MTKRIEILVEGKPVSMSLEEAQKHLEKLASGPTYYSHSKGEEVVIAEMALPYLINAVCKRARNYFDKARRHTMSASEFLEYFFQFSEDSDIVNLITELQSRVEVEV